MKIVLFGAGYYSITAIHLLKKENIMWILDNDVSKSGHQIEGIPIYCPVDKKDSLKSYQIIVSVSQKYQSEIIQQLRDMGATDIKTIQEVQTAITKRKIESRTDYLNIYNRAITWIKNNTVDGRAIICNTNKKIGYPEVTGYYIPTLLRWGYRDLAISFAKWLCEIQNVDGSWNDTDNANPYIFDTAQILKGLLAIREIYPQVDEHLIKGCDWILSNMLESGKLITPSTDAWGHKQMCSELVHLYCLSPLVQCADIFKKTKYKECAYKILNYYKTNCYEEIMNFHLLSHFYAYVIEALLDMGEWNMAAEAMKKIAVLQRDDGSVPAYCNVEWVCSTGLFQFALIWFRLGNIERGNNAFTYACKLQNETGGWYGSYLSERNVNEDNDYFPNEEISWAVKYFLDALYYKNLAEFNLCADSFLNKISKNDGRYDIIQKLVSTEQDLKGKNLTILDVGCGKGRYLKNLIEDTSSNLYHAVDLSETVMQYIEVEQIYKKQGSLTNISYPDKFFDITYTCEALEHAIDIKSAIREMIRVTKSGGKIAIIDKNKEKLGCMEIKEWEMWFDKNELATILFDYCTDVKVVDNINYEQNNDDKLFLAWIGTVK